MGNYENQLWESCGLMERWLPTPQHSVGMPQPSLETSPWRQTGYDLLESTPPIPTTILEGEDVLSNTFHAKYLLMHKVIVGQQGSEQLEGIYEGLKDEVWPRHLIVAGWAAVEAGVSRTKAPVQERVDLLAKGSACWIEAIGRQKWLNIMDDEDVIDDALPHRIAVDLAVLPLVQGLINGLITPEKYWKVFADCLNIAESNLIAMRLAFMNQNWKGASEHSGLGHEMNTLLAFNRRMRGNKIVIPAMARCDTGYYYGAQTHDLLVIKYEGDELQRVTPIEVKSAASLRDRKRYKSMLVRGKMHLSPKPGQYAPEFPLQIFSDEFTGRATPEQKQLAQELTTRVEAMERDYTAGRALSRLATGWL